MRNQIQTLAPVLGACLTLGAGEHISDRVHLVRQSVLSLQRDQQGSEPTTRQEELTFGSNRSGDYYEGALPP